MGTIYPQRIIEEGMIKKEVIHQNNTLIQLETKPSVYYPWNDGVDYNTFCMSLKNRLESFKGPMIIHRGCTGGLGHKFFSLYRSITYALFLERPLSRIILLKIQISCNV